MHLDDLLGNREPKAGAALGLGVGTGDLVELLKDARLLLLGNARPRVDHADDEVAVHRFCNDAHLASIGELDGVTNAAAPRDKLQNAPLSATELRAELPGNTFGSGGLRVFIGQGGRQYVAVGTRVDLGRWRITAAGLYCRTWNVTDGARERCYHVYRDGETFDFHVNDRWTVLRWTRTAGAPPISNRLVATTSRRDWTGVSAASPPARARHSGLGLGSGSPRTA